MFGDLMQGRAQWIVGEELFPHAGREFMRARRRMLSHALQHVDQIIVGIDIVQLARHQEALRDADLLDYAPRSAYCECSMISGTIGE